MAEVSGCLRTGAHKLCAFYFLRTHHHLSAADRRSLWPCADEFMSPAGSSSSAEVLNKHTQTRGYCTPPGKPSRLRAGRLGTRAFSGESSAPLYRSRTAYYDILKVSPKATQAQIKSAYYKQSFMNHPDRNRSEDAARLFALVAEAYSVLGNSGLRRKYDRGILNQTDLQNAGKPSSSAASNLQGQRPRRAPDADAHFDFDAFYQAHYGEQLQREQQMRYRREQMRQQQQETRRTWKLMKMNEVTVAFLLMFGGVILISLKS